MLPWRHDGDVVLGFEDPPELFAIQIDVGMARSGGVILVNQIGGEPETFGRDPDVDAAIGVRFR